MIFLTLRFYVKSIYGILEVPFQHFERALNVDFNEFLHFLMAEN